MSALFIAVLRGAIGLAIVGLAIVGLIFSIMAEGGGCAGSIVLGIFFLIMTIAYNTVSEEAIEAFLGMSAGDYLPVVLIPAVAGFFFPSSHIAGVATSLAVGFTGLLVTGFLDAATIAALSQGVIDVGIVVMLPIVLPMIIIIIVGTLICKSF